MISLLDINVLMALGWAHHPQHTYFESLPKLAEADFEPLARILQGSRQVADAILLAIARQNSATLVTF